MKTKEEIEQLAKKMFDDIDKPTRSGKDKHSYLVGVQEGYTQCQEDMADKKYTLRDIEKAFLGGCRSEKRFSRRIDELDKYINSLNKQD
jgi:hypothetical protein